MIVYTGGRHAGQAVGNPKPCETCTRTALRDRSNDLTFSPLVNGRSKATRDFQNKDTPSTAKNCVEMDWDMGRDAKSNDESECDIDNEKLYEDMPSLVGMTASDLVGQSWTPICVEDDDSDDEVHSEDEGGDGEWEKQEPVTVPCTTVRECQLDDMPQYDPLFMENSDTSGNNQDQQSFAGHDTTKPSSQGLWGYLTRRGTYGSSSESPTTAASDLSTSSSSPSSSSASSSSFSSCTCSSPAQDPQDSEQRLFDTWLSFRDSNSLIPELDGDGRVLLMQENGLDLTDMTGSGASEITSPRLHQLSSGGETAVAPRVRKDASFCESPAAEPQEYQDGSNDSSGTLRNSRRNVSSRARIPRVSGLAGPAKDGRPTTTVAEHIAGGPRRFHRATSVVADAGIGQKASTIVSNENDLGVTSRSVRHGIVTKITPVIPDKDNSAVGVNDLDDAARSPSAEDATWDRRAFSKNTAHVAKAEVAPIHGRPTATVVEHIAGEFAGFFRTPVVRSCGDVGDEGNDLWHLRAAERTYPRSSDVFPEETAPAAVSRCSTVSSVGDMPAETVAARDDAHVAVVVDDAGTEDCAEDELPLLEKLGSNSGCVHEGDQVPQRDNHRTNHDPAWRKSSRECRPIGQVDRSRADGRYLPYAMTAQTVWCASASVLHTQLKTCAVPNEGIAKQCTVILLER